MKKASFLSFLVIVFLSLNYQSAQAQIIKDMENALEGISESAGGGGSDAGLWIDLFVNIFYYPTWGLLIGFEDEPLPNEIEFSKFPYENADEGIYRKLGWNGDFMRGQFTTHFQNNENTLSGGYFQLKFSPTRYLNLDINHLQLFEKVPGEDETDHLGITNFNVSYNRIRHEKIQAWWGGGLMLLNGDNLWGSPSFTVGTTIFIKKPLSLYADIQVGFPNGVVATQSQIRMQAHVNRFFIYGGYQGLRAGEVFEPSWAFGTGVYF